MSCVVVGLSPATSGIWTRCFCDQWHTALSVAGGRSGGPWARHAGPKSPEQKGGEEFFRKLLKGFQYVPRMLITDQLKSYGSAKGELLPSVEHRQHAT